MVNMYEELFKDILSGNTEDAALKIDAIFKDQSADRTDFNPHLTLSTNDTKIIINQNSATGDVTYDVKQHNININDHKNDLGEAISAFKEVTSKQTDMTSYSFKDHDGNISTVSIDAKKSDSENAVGVASILKENGNEDFISPIKNIETENSANGSVYREILSNDNIFERTINADGNATEKLIDKKNGITDALEYKAVPIEYDGKTYNATKVFANGQDVTGRVYSQKIDTITNKVETALINDVKTSSVEDKAKAEKRLDGFNKDEFKANLATGYVESPYRGIVKSIITKESDPYGKVVTSFYGMNSTDLKTDMFALLFKDAKGKDHIFSTSYDEKGKRVDVKIEKSSLISTIPDSVTYKIPDKDIGAYNGSIEVPLINNEGNLINVSRIELSSESVRDSKYNIGNIMNTKLECGDKTQNMCEARIVTVKITLEDNVSLSNGRTYNISNPEIIIARAVINDRGEVVKNGIEPIRLDNVQSAPDFFKSYQPAFDKLDAVAKNDTASEMERSVPKFELNGVSFEGYNGIHFNPSAAAAYSNEQVPGIENISKDYEKCIDNIIGQAIEKSPVMPDVKKDIRSEIETAKTNYINTGIERNEAYDKITSARENLTDDFREMASLDAKLDIYRDENKEIRTNLTDDEKKEVAAIKDKMDSISNKVKVEVKAYLDENVPRIDKNEKGEKSKYIPNTIEARSGLHGVSISYRTELNNKITEYNGIDSRFDDSGKIVGDPISNTRGAAELFETTSCRPDPSSYAAMDDKIKGALESDRAKEVGINIDKEGKASSAIGFSVPLSVKNGETSYEKMTFDVENIKEDKFESLGIRDAQFDNQNIDLGSFLRKHAGEISEGKIDDIESRLTLLSNVDDNRLTLKGYIEKLSGEVTLSKRSNVDEGQVADLTGSIASYGTETDKLFAEVSAMIDDRYRDIAEFEGKISPTDNEEQKDQATNDQYEEQTVKDDKTDDGVENSKGQATKAEEPQNNETLKDFNNYKEPDFTENDKFKIEGKPEERDPKGLVKTNGDVAGITKDSLTSECLNKIKNEARVEAESLRPGIAVDIREKENDYSDSPAIKAKIDSAVDRKAFELETSKINERIELIKDKAQELESTLDKIKEAREERHLTNDDPIFLAYRCVAYEKSYEIKEMGLETGKDKYLISGASRGDTIDVGNEARQSLEKNKTSNLIAKSGYEGLFFPSFILSIVLGPVSLCLIPAVVAKYVIVDIPKLKENIEKNDVIKNEIESMEKSLKAAEGKDDVENSVLEKDDIDLNSNEAGNDVENNPKEKETVDEKISDDNDIEKERVEDSNVEKTDEEPKGTDTDVSNIDADESDKETAVQNENENNHQVDNNQEDATSGEVKATDEHEDNSQNNDFEEKNDDEIEVVGVGNLENEHEQNAADEDKKEQITDNKNKDNEDNEDIRTINDLKSDVTKEEKTDKIKSKAEIEKDKEKDDHKDVEKDSQPKDEVESDKKDETSKLENGSVSQEETKNNQESQTETKPEQTIEIQSEEQPVNESEGGSVENENQTPAKDQIDAVSDGIEDNKEENKDVSEKTADEVKSNIKEKLEILLKSDSGDYEGLRDDVMNDITDALSANTITFEELNTIVPDAINNIGEDVSKDTLEERTADIIKNVAQIEAEDINGKNELEKEELNNGVDSSCTENAIEANNSEELIVGNDNEYNLENSPDVSDAYGNASEMIKQLDGDLLDIKAIENNVIDMINNDNAVETSVEYKDESIPVNDVEGFSSTIYEPSKEDDFPKKIEALIDESIEYDSKIDDNITPDQINDSKVDQSTDSQIVIDTDTLAQQLQNLANDQNNDNDFNPSDVTAEMLNELGTDDLTQLNDIFNNKNISDDDKISALKDMLDKNDISIDNSYRNDLDARRTND